MVEASSPDVAGHRHVDPVHRPARIRDRPGSSVIESVRNGTTARWRLARRGRDHGHRHRDHPRRRDRRHHDEGRERQGSGLRHDGRELMAQHRDHHEARPRLRAQRQTEPAAGRARSHRSVTVGNAHAASSRTPRPPASTRAARSSGPGGAITHACNTTRWAAGAPPSSPSAAAGAARQRHGHSANDLPTTFPATVHPGQSKLDRLVRTP